MKLDPASPLINAMNKRHRVTRDMDQLIGLCQGVMADGHVSAQEADMLRTWIGGNYELRDQWPAQVLLSRLEAALEDGSISDEENRLLLKALMDFTGMSNEAPGSHSPVTTLPLTEPAPNIAFVNQSFVVTGNFAYGPRKMVIEAIEGAGGSVVSSVSGKTSFLVIGLLGSENWRHSSFGSKIEKAMALRGAGASIAIVSEQHWYSQLP